MTFLYYSMMKMREQVEQAGANQSNYSDSGIVSLRRQFNEMKLLNDALMAMETQMHCPSQVYEALDSVGFSLAFDNSHQKHQVGLLKIDLHLLQMTLRNILDCLNRRGRVGCNLKIKEQQQSLSIVMPAADSGLLENSVIATFAIDILTKMGAKVVTDTESITVSFQSVQ